MGSVAARTPGFTTGQRFVQGGIYASMGVIGLVIFVLEGPSGASLATVFLPVISACWLGLASWYLIPAAVRYRRERGGRDAASQP
jgi:hypothetical protein